MTRSWDRQLAAFALLAAGAFLWNRFGSAGGRAIWIAIAVVFVLWAIPPVEQKIASLAKRFGDYLGQHRAATAISIAILIAAHLGSQAWRFRSGLYLKFHDEHVYLIQAHMLARGWLWLAPYPANLVDFFDSFYLIMDRVYAGMYPPGAAMLLLPAVWFAMPYWVMPLISGIAAAFFFSLILEEIFGPIKAIAGVVLLIGMTLFVSMSLMALSETPFLLAQMLAFWSWMRWRSSRKVGWAVLLGVACGYGAITRPADMFCVAFAIGVAILGETRRQPKTLLKTAAVICIAAMPFLVVQIVQDTGVTGSWLKSPIRHYTDENYPSPILSFRMVSAKDVPPTDCLPKQAAMKQWILPDTEQHARLSLWEIWYPERFRELFGQTLATPLLLFLLPVSILSLGEIRRATIVGSALLFCVIYTADTVFLPHYFIAIAPAMIVIVLCGWESIERSFRPTFSTLALMTMIVVSLFSLTEFDRSAALLGSTSDEQRKIDERLASLTDRPALVLFRFDPKINSFHTEPVYNDDVAWPDDARIVKARDLGAGENVRLYRYYRDRGQDRDVYLYDRAAAKGHNPLKRLGTVNELAGS